MIDNGIATRAPPSWSRAYRLYLLGAATPSASTPTPSPQTPDSQQGRRSAVSLIDLSEDSKWNNQSRQPHDGFSEHNVDEEEGKFPRRQPKLCHTLQKQHNTFASAHNPAVWWNFRGERESALAKIEVVRLSEPVWSSTNVVLVLPAWAS